MNLLLLCKNWVFYKSFLILYVNSKNKISKTKFQKQNFKNKKQNFKNKKQNFKNKISKNKISKNKKQNFKNKISKNKISKNKISKNTFNIFEKHQ